MNSENTRVTRAQAAALARVSQRTVSRWSAAGLITPRYGPMGSTELVTYDPEEVQAAVEKWKARHIAERARLAAEGRVKAPELELPAE